MQSVSCRPYISVDKSFVCCLACKDSNNGWQRSPAKDPPPPPSPLLLHSQPLNIPPPLPPPVPSGITPQTLLYSSNLHILCLFRFPYFSLFFFITSPFIYYSFPSLFFFHLSLSVWSNFSVKILHIASSIYSSQLPSILRRRMLGLNPGLLRHSQWRSDALTYRQDLIHI